MDICHLGTIHTDKIYKISFTDKNPSEVWAYMNMRVFRTDGEGIPVETEEMSVPVTHWESVIGRDKNCDISIEDPALSRNHGILMRDTRGEWTYRDLGSKERDSD